MSYLQVYTSQQLENYLRLRKGETKIGEKFKLLNKGLSFNEGLAASSARFVILGLPEDLGVRANFGRGGAHTEWHPALSFLTNVQSNRFLVGDEILLLGHIDFVDLMQQAADLDLHYPENIHKLRDLVALADERVYPVIQQIVANGKIPIVVGGGHNNAYGMIRGASLGIQKPISVLNIDAHSDLRETEGRHSGNGFRYALEEGFLLKYFILGLHENYTPEQIWQLLDSHPNLQYSLFEDIAIRHKTTITEAVDIALNFLNAENLGIELDIDSIQNMPSSARTSSGFMANEVRSMVAHAASQKEFRYFHICEGAPTLTHKLADIKTGKLVAYLITDFIKAQNTLQ